MSPHQARALEGQQGVGRRRFRLVGRGDKIVDVSPVAKQGQGLGSTLVRRGVECAREFGCHGLLVLGDPAYYGRFGFSAEAAREVAAPFRGQPAFQALALEEGAFSAPISVAYPDAFAGDH